MDTDHLLIDVDLPSPAILLLTDSYSRSWRILPRPGTSFGEDSRQSSYTLLPANYCLQAIPLQPGHHRLLLEYRPLAFVIGKWISLATLPLYLLLWLWHLRPLLRRKANIPQPALSLSKGS